MAKERFARLEMKITFQNLPTTGIVNSGLKSRRSIVRTIFRNSRLENQRVKDYGKNTVIFLFF